MKKILTALIALVIVVCFLIFYENSPKHGGVTTAMLPAPTDVSQARGVDEAPMQKRYRGAAFFYDNVEVKPLYEFIVTARVLSKKNYSDNDSRYAPTDLALGWGRMSQPQVLKNISIRQNNRWFFWETPQLPIPKKEIMHSAANMHLIPASPEVQAQIDAVKTGNIVQISGKLVNLSRQDGWYWRSSTTRKDSGDGACELVFVEAVTILE